MERVYEQWSFLLGDTKVLLLGLNLAYVCVSIPVINIIKSDIKGVVNVYYDTRYTTLNHNSYPGSLIKESIHLNMNEEQYGMVEMQQVYQQKP